jgi:hypothetical protein
MLTKKKDPKTWNSNGTTTGKYLKKEAPSDVPSKNKHKPAVCIPSSLTNGILLSFLHSHQCLDFH